MSATDAMLARFQAELEERRRFVDGLVEAAEAAGRDLTAEEMELYKRARDRMQEIAGQMEPLQEGARIAVESRTRTQELVGMYADGPRPAGATSSTAPPAPTSPTCTTPSSATRTPRTGIEVVQPCRRPPDDRRQPRSAAGDDRVAARQLHRGRPPARSARSARPTSGPAPGPTPGSPSTPRSASRPVRRPSWRRARC